MNWDPVQPHRPVFAFVPLCFGCSLLWPMCQVVPHHELGTLRWVGLENSSFRFSILKKWPGNYRPWSCISIWPCWVSICTMVVVRNSTLLYNSLSRSIMYDGKIWCMFDRITCTKLKLKLMYVLYNIFHRTLLFEIYYFVDLFHTITIYID